TTPGSWARLGSRTTGCRSSNSATHRPPPQTCNVGSRWIRSNALGLLLAGGPMKGLLRLLALVCVVGLATAGVTVARAETRFVLVSHAPDSDSWWNTIKNAI